MPDVACPRIIPLLDALRPLLGDRVSSAAGLRAQFGRSEAYRDPSLPDLVARPLDTTEVQAVVPACGRFGVPLVPFGAGTSLEGNAAPVLGGVSLDMGGMDAVIAVHAADMDVRTQPGRGCIEVGSDLVMLFAKWRTLPEGAMSMTTAVEHGPRALNNARIESFGH